MKLSVKQFYFIKFIACFTMLLDHLIIGIYKNIDPDFIYYLGRFVGRLAAPLFVYCLVQSFYHTKSKQDHLFYLLVIAAFSEPIYISYFGLGYHNICFTLLLVFCSLMAEGLTDKVIFKYILKYIFLIISAFISYSMRFDSWFICLFAIWFDLEFNLEKNVYWSVDTSSEVSSVKKWLYRLFYPAHLFILCFIF